ncbi:hypothetical protein BST97_01475 [Nonlabens spongiae]|uniref:Uncharacterized protein n=1 Tax=Nonlabens spongiae TaxID=331648 RepID=A0A1W6MGZ1_9FLAO|nr:hypothetical protein BST97_01475 [Nonlabens spongiae]
MFYRALGRNSNRKTLWSLTSYAASSLTCLPSTKGEALLLLSKSISLQTKGKMSESLLSNEKGFTERDDGNATVKPSGRSPATLPRRRPVSLPPREKLFCS